MAKKKRTPEQIETDIKALFYTPLCRDGRSYDPAAIALTGDFFEVNGEFEILTADLTAKPQLLKF